MFKKYSQTFEYSKRNWVLYHYPTFVTREPKSLKVCKHLHSQRFFSAIKDNGTLQQYLPLIFWEGYTLIAKGVELQGQYGHVPTNIQWIVFSNDFKCKNSNKIAVFCQCSEHEGLHFSFSAASPTFLTQYRFRMGFSVSCCVVGWSFIYFRNCQSSVQWFVWMRERGRLYSNNTVLKIQNTSRLVLSQ